MARSGTNAPPPVVAGPWKGVLDLADPFAVPSGYLARATNSYLPDPSGRCGAYARPGAILANPETPFGSPGARTGQSMAIATIANGLSINFYVCGGRLYRLTNGISTREDVTPLDVTIDPAARVFLTPFSNRLAVNDGVHTPWVASDLQASPVVATPIQYSGPGVAWRAYGPGVVWQGALLFVVRERDGEERTVRFAWSEADDPLVGYFQPDFDNEWDLVENGTSPLYALVGTNRSLVYFREFAIGAITGVFPDLETTSSHDAIDEAHGSRAPASIVQFGDKIYFADAQGKPMRCSIGGPLEDLSLQLRRAVTEAGTRYPAVTQQTACASLVPELDLVAFALWSPNPAAGTLQYPTTLHVFGAQSGTYMGQWVIGPGVLIHTIGVLLGENGEPVFVVAGGKAGATSPQDAQSGGYLWVLAALDAEVWKDNDEVPLIEWTTGLLGYSADRIINVDRAVAVMQSLNKVPIGSDGTLTIGADGVLTYHDPTGATSALAVGDGAGSLFVDDAGVVTYRDVTGVETRLAVGVGSAGSIVVENDGALVYDDQPGTSSVLALANDAGHAQIYRCTMQTASVAHAVEGEAVPVSSGDLTSRVVWGCDIGGRGVGVTLRALNADGQSVFQRLELTVAISNAGPEDG